MVKFTIDLVRSIMERPSNIRNISVIAHVDHGKSSLVDLLLAAAGMISMEDAGSVRATDNRPDEKARGITIKSTGVTLYFEMPEESKLPADCCGREFVFNLIDSPGHVDFSSEVTAALRVTDGGLVIVDMVEGVCVQTETVLRQALTECVAPVLVINKMDRGFLEQKLDPEEMYKAFVRVIEDTNLCISNFRSEVMGEIFLTPEKGNVAFASGIQGWSFTLMTFARIYASKFGISAEKIVSKLWGDNYFDPETKKWTESCVSASGKPLQRGFCKFIIEPIALIFRACMEGDWIDLDKRLVTLGVTLKENERKFEGKKLLKAVMQNWLPAGEALLEMAVLHLPSPVKAQRYRCEGLYTGPMDDPTAESIRNCDPNGPLVMYVSKLVPADNNRFYAFGRVFSGTIRTGTPVRILGQNFEVGKNNDVFVKMIQRAVVMMGKKIEAVDSVPCGNTCALFGIDQYILKCATLTSDESSWPIVSMKFSVSPVVEIAVEPKNAADLPKMVEGLKKLMNGDSLIQSRVEESSGKYILAGAGELHLEICLNDLALYTRCEIKTSPPIVTYKETVTDESSLLCCAKTVNKLNRFYCQAAPLSENLLLALDEGKINENQDPKKRTRQLADEFGWNADEARKIWAFGPVGQTTNVLTDCTKGIALLHEVKDHVVSGFQWATKEGILCGEGVRGVRYNVMDVVLHSDGAHRRSAQVLPAARRVFYAAQLTAKPKLVEPVYLVEISCPQSAMGGVYSVMNKKRGKIIEENVRIGTPLTNVKCYLPVQEAFGFTADLRQATSGMAFPQCVFDHWEVVQGDPLEKGSKAEELVQSIRKRKGLALEIPSLDNFHDRL